MGIIIKMIRTSQDNSLFLYGINKKDELVFRTTRNIKQLQKETVVLDKGICYTNLYHFDINFLVGLPILE